MDKDRNTAEETNTGRIAIEDETFLNKLLAGGAFIKERIAMTAKAGVVIKAKTKKITKTPVTGPARNNLPSIIASL